MALEDLTGTKYIDSLNASNPASTDVKSEGDDHLRGIKNVVKTTFPGITGAVTSTQTELNLLDGKTSVVEIDSTDTLTNKTLASPAFSGTVSTDLVMADGKGLDFSAYTDGSAAGTTINQVLLDYEEGTWTPELFDTSGSGGEAQTYSTQVGHYTKIGNVVNITGHLIITSLGTLTAGDGAFIGGLPYTSKTSSTSFQSISFGYGANLSIGVGVSVTGIVTQNSTQMQLFEWNTTTGPTTVLISELTGTSELAFSGYYIV